MNKDDITQAELQRAYEEALRGLDPDLMAEGEDKDSLLSERAKYQAKDMLSKALENKGVPARNAEIAAEKAISSAKGGVALSALSVASALKGIIGTQERNAIAKEIEEEALGDINKTLGTESKAEELDNLIGLKGYPSSYDHDYYSGLHTPSWLPSKDDPATQEEINHELSKIFQKNGLYPDGKTSPIQNDVNHALSMINLLGNNPEITEDKVIDFIKSTNLQNSPEVLQALHKKLNYTHSYAKDKATLDDPIKAFKERSTPSEEVDSSLIMDLPLNKKSLAAKKEANDTYGAQKMLNLEKDATANIQIGTLFDSGKTRDEIIALGYPENMVDQYIKRTQEPARYDVLKSRATRDQNSINMMMDLIAQKIGLGLPDEQVVEALNNITLDDIKHFRESYQASPSYDTTREALREKLVQDQEIYNKQQYLLSELKDISKHRNDPLFNTRLGKILDEVVGDNKEARAQLHTLEDVKTAINSMKVSPSHAIDAENKIDNLYTPVETSNIMAQDKNLRTATGYDEDLFKEQKDIPEEIKALGELPYLEKPESALTKSTRDSYFGLNLDEARNVINGLNDLKASFYQNGTTASPQTQKQAVDEIKKAEKRR